MKIERIGDEFAFSLTTKQGKVTVNADGGEVRVFLSEQKEDQENMLHWPGEYEKLGVAAFLKDVGGESFLGKIFVEHIRVVFFTDSGVEYSDEFFKEFGNTDILIFEKGQSSKNKEGESDGDKKSSSGFTESQVKKLIESVDPRVLIGTAGKTMEFLKKLSLPVLPKENLTFSKSSLPAEHTEYYIL